MREEHDRQAYALGSGGFFLGGKKCVLDEALLPVSGQLGEPGRSFGWVSRGLPLPPTGGSYAVEFVDKSHVFILAYIDPYGRAFSTEKPLTIPPAREPDLLFSKDTAASLTGRSNGFVRIREQLGETRDVARFSCVSNAYELLDSWYDFGRYRAGLSYEDAMTRAYLAFVHRPSLGSVPVPSVGLTEVYRCLDNASFLASAKKLRDLFDRVGVDAALEPPALAESLMRWLDEAGLPGVLELGASDAAIRLVRTMRYAGTFYLSLEEDIGVSRKTIWALEGALNRFLLACERLDALATRAARATKEEISACDEELFETAAIQPIAELKAHDFPEATPGGEWDVRSKLGRAAELLRLPMRVDAKFRCDVASGLVALDLTAPGADLMPATTWMSDDDGAAGGHGLWMPVSTVAREAQAERYAFHLGLLLAAKAFEASPSIDRVELAVRFLGEEDSDLHDGGLLSAPMFPAYATVGLSRAAFEETDGFAFARASDPQSFFREAGARHFPDAIGSFVSVLVLPSAKLRRELPEIGKVPLSGFAAQALGVDDSTGMRINFDAALRRRGEDIADGVAQTTSASAAIRVVRQAQDAAQADFDERAINGCTRLMAALAEGKIDCEDQNAVVSCFLGADRCLTALGRAKTFAENDDVSQAVAVLQEAIAEAEALEGFVDTSLNARRAFDSYSSRVIYNLARRGDLPDPQAVRNDQSKYVELVPDSFYLCHLEVVRMLEHSFERSEEAVEYGRRSIAIAPTAGAGYRQLGRAYMLMGDMENAAQVLEECLRIAVQPNDIAMAYYQLAYVLWKLGRAEAGAACYAKSLATAPVMAMQATIELHELVEETGLPLPDQDKVDDTLVRLGVPLAPSKAVLDALERACVAAVDAGLFPVAQSILATRLRYRPDDALVNVLRSLD
ncbi:hypothetical protein GMI70_00390 [Eggerthellaceae bacterium zg-893]|nr:hypothetical protein [Eggerthellaceae bacterium zg-893]